MNSHDLPVCQAAGHHHDGEVPVPSPSTMGAARSIAGEGAHRAPIGERRRRYPGKSRGARDIAIGNLEQPTHHDSATPISAEACPRCQRRVIGYRFATDGDLFIVTYHCAEHGDVVPMRDVGTRGDSPPLHS